VDEGGRVAGSRANLCKQPSQDSIKRHQASARRQNSSIHELTKGEVCGWDALKQSSHLDTELIVKMY